jgi:uncharacterized membrane protein YvlD (DUF360 family)
MAYHYLWPEVEMLLHVLVSWLVSAVALWLVARIVPGLALRGFGSALVATIVAAVLRHVVFLPGRAWTTL